MSTLAVDPTRAPAEPLPEKPAHKEAQHLGEIVSDNTLEHEDAQEMADLLAGAIATYLPQSPIQEELVRQLATAIHRLRRFDRMETAALFSDETARTRHEAAVIIQQKFASMPAFMQNLYRARGQAERTFNRVYKELQLIVAARHYRPEAPTHLEVERDTRHRPLAQNKPAFYGKTFQNLQNKPSPEPPAPDFTRRT